MYVDTADDVMRLLALPLEKLEGDTVTIAGHNLKVVKAKMATSTKLYAVNSKAKPMLDAITAHGHPAPLPSDLGLEDVEQFVQQRPAGTAREYFELSPGAGEENDDTNVALMAQILDIKDMLGDFRTRLANLERERKVPTIRNPLRGLSHGVRFSDDDEDDDGAGGLEFLRSEVKQHATSRPAGARVPRTQDPLEFVGPSTAELRGEMLPRDMAVLEYVFNEDLLHIPDDTRKATSGASGFAAKAKLDEDFRVTPYAK